MNQKPQLAGGNQLAIYKRGPGFELGTKVNKSSNWRERDSNPGPPDCEADELTTLPRCLRLKGRLGQSQAHNNRSCRPSFGPCALGRSMVPGPAVFGGDMFIFRILNVINEFRVLHFIFKDGAQVAQARNMSIGEHRHCCVTFKI